MAKNIETDSLGIATLYDRDLRTRFSEFLWQKVSPIMIGKGHGIYPLWGSPSTVEDEKLEMTLRQYAPGMILLPLDLHPSNPPRWKASSDFYKKIRRVTDLPIMALAEIHYTTAERNGLTLELADSDKLYTPEDSGYLADPNQYAAAFDPVLREFIATFNRPKNDFNEMNLF